MTSKFYCMNNLDLSKECKNKNHLDCDDCMCKCHIPGTMENLARKIAKLEKQVPGLGETL
jgi:hypothetical protein